jgi:hypothetical protein
VVRRQHGLIFHYNITINLLQGVHPMQSVLLGNSTDIIHLKGKSLISLNVVAGSAHDNCL